MSYIFLIGSVQAFFLAIVLICRPKSSLPNLILCSWMLILGLNLLGAFLGSTGFYRIHPDYFGFDAALPLLHGPALYLYTLLSTKKRPVIRPPQLLHLTPFLFFGIYIYIATQIPATTDRYHYIATLFADASDPIILLFEIGIHLSLLIYVFLAIRHIKTYQLSIVDTYSYTENVNLKWLQRTLAGLSVISIIILLSILISDILQVLPLDFKAILLYGALSLLPFYLMFFAIRHGIVYPSDDRHQIQKFSQKYSASNLSENDIKDIKSRLLKVMEEEKPYLNGKLSITHLADLLQIHIKELSQIINEQFGKNFFNFINEYRIEEFKNRVRSGEHQHLSFLGMALDCGFNSKSSFNAIFKKITGQTPSSYLKNLE